MKDLGNKLKNLIIESENVEFEETDYTDHVDDHPLLKYLDNNYIEVRDIIIMLTCRDSHKRTDINFRKSALNKLINYLPL